MRSARQRLETLTLIYLMVVQIPRNGLGADTMPAASLSNVLYILFTEQLSYVTADHNAGMIKARCHLQVPTMA